MFRKNKGFSIIELMVGILILSSLIVLVAGLYTRLFKMSSKGVDLTAGTAVGEKVLEEFVQDKINIPLQSSSGLPELSNSFYGSKSINGSIFSYRVQVIQPAETPSLKIVDVTIKWWDNAGGLAGLDNSNTNMNYKKTAFFDGDNYLDPSASNIMPVTEYGLSNDSSHAIDSDKMFKSINNYGAAYTRLTKVVFVPN